MLRWIECKVVCRIRVGALSRGVSPKTLRGEEVDQGRKRLHEKEQEKKRWDEVEQERKGRDKIEQKGKGGMKMSKRSKRKR